MKWFKHLTGSLNNSLVFELIEDFGSDGYLVFFGTIELMADEFDVYNPGYNRLSVKKLCKSFQLSRQKTVKILRAINQKSTEKLQKIDEKLAKNLQKTGKMNQVYQILLYSKLKKIPGFFCEIKKGEVEIICLRLKDLCDEYTQKQISKISGQSPDKDFKKSGQSPDQETETETETDYIKTLRGQILELNTMAKKDKVDFKAEAFFAPFIKKNDCSLKLAVEVSDALIKGWPTIKTTPYAFANGVYKNRKQNHNERDAVAKAQEFKSQWSEITADVANLSKGIG